MQHLSMYPFLAPLRKGSARIIGVLAALIAVFAFALNVSSASALPPGGAGDSTAGTSSTVSSQVAVGGTISFTVSGFPAGETVYIKIDDGTTSGEDTSQQGTGVVHSQAIGADGTASGSFVLPAYVGEGQHWLRFLATSSAGSKDGGSVGYTNKSPYFTVGGTSSSQEVNSSTTVNQSGTESTGTSNGTSAQSTTDAQAVPTAATEAQLTGASASASASATTATPTSASATASVASAQESKNTTEFPLVGTVVLGITVLVVVIVLAVALTRRRKMSQES